MYRTTYFTYGTVVNANSDVCDCCSSVFNHAPIFLIYQGNLLVLTSGGVIVTFPVYWTNIICHAP